ncbi:uncharacterized protein UV8b_03587 [Ustilaginoidea virens]|uniref:Uncharacterized protein n=1 Tax=Ustilaginoidea virens TaxID=1159556 RepID=A0A8E5HPS1_USTVR|nr:uncharacterized protein UV8b_03587 [Ustilaginoidea virens]QUC19346.1 hypothetical protein UV8b_03587 [Ustilaginoidea virens]
MLNYGRRLNNGRLNHSRRLIYSRRLIHNHHNLGFLASQQHQDGDTNQRASNAGGSNTSSRSFQAAARNGGDAPLVVVKTTISQRLTSRSLYTTEFQ